MFCKTNNIKQVAMPKMGSGLDQLNSNFVKYLTYSEFKDYNMVINVYSYSKPNKSKINISPPSVIAQSLSCLTSTALNNLSCDLDVTPVDVHLCANNMSVATPRIPKRCFSFSTPLKMVYPSLSTSILTAPSYNIVDPFSASELGSPITLEKTPPFSLSLSTTLKQ
jgi:hypothetical protein